MLGAGTVTTAEQVSAAIEAGARFLVSPGAPVDVQDPLSRTPILSLCSAHPLQPK